MIKHKGKAAGRRILAHFNGSTGRDVLPQYDDSVDRYPTVRYLAEGGSGKVHLCEDRKQGTLVAVKSIQYDDTSMPHEAQIIQQLGRHANIVKCYDVADHPAEEFYKRIVFEYCPLGDLADYIEQCDGDVPELFIWHAFNQITQGLQHIHATGIVHGDLKLANVLLASPPRGALFPTLKIADFGASLVKPPAQIPRTHRGTWAYASPEAEFLFGPETDVWALGCIIHYLANKRLPFHSIEMNDLDSVEAWFDKTGRAIPPGTPFRRDYKHFCYWLAEHPVVITRVDKSSKCSTMTRTKLLNYFMHRVLDTDWKTRITTNELQRFMTVLEPFVFNVKAAGYHSVLESFEEGLDVGVNEGATSRIMDSYVVMQMFCALAILVSKWKDPHLLGFGKDLLTVMNTEHHAQACRCLCDVKLDLPWRSQHADP
ncbi:kinase-like protein [Trematosphaeria pertusa]|uniref:Autophagy-related protein 1 n=1 Tax=Trematosphaeria pertusa TaxID=390896 RepID=A0A6A6HTS2_9PLEO|nr:kinase-like protein [Trematosphaeria pertusa]KAF2241182.1 kinase-like protein [Trematosphaeria pertusa]